MKKIFLFLIIFGGALLTGISQDTITIRPDPLEGKDAVLWSVHPDNNYGGSQKFTAMGWTFYGVPGAKRSIIDFDLSGIPAGAEVSEAFMSLYFFSDEPTWVPHSGNNQAYLKLITGEWSEDSVTWNTMPATTDED